MSKIIKEKEYLTLLAKTKNRKKRAALIDLATANEINALSELIVNILNANVPLNPKTKTRLVRYKTDLRELCKKTLSTKTKKRLLQKGGILNVILPLAISALSSLIPAIIKKVKRRK